VKDLKNRLTSQFGIEGDVILRGENGDPIETEEQLRGVRQIQLEVVGDGDDYSEEEFEKEEERYGVQLD